MPRNHSTDSDATEQVAYQVLYPPEARQLLREGIINHSEYVVLGAIHGYAHAHCPARGCFASNEVLGEDCRLGERQIQNIIKALKNKFLVKNFIPQVGTMRTIYVDWKRQKPKIKRRM